LPLILFSIITVALAIQRWFDGDRWPVFAVCLLLLVLIWRFMTAIFKLRDRQAIERIMSQR
jgi:hypothetical protein